MVNEKHISLSELLGGVKRLLAERYPLGVWVSAEIGELKINRSGHCYMELIEKGDLDGVPKAKTTAVVWRTQWGMISNYFRSTTGTDLTEGMSVLLKVSVTFHEAYGFSLTVTDIDPVYTIGENSRRRQQTIEQLRTEGVFDLNGSLEFPLVVQRIAIVSSATAAGLQDFRNHLGASAYRFEVELFEAVVQGAAAEESIIGALELIAERAESFDAVVIIRGGGAQSDLGCFNSYMLCNNIAQFPLPVITGIGHDKDMSVADMVAAKALKTPTAAADFLVGCAESFCSDADMLYDSIVDRAQEILERQQIGLERYASTLSAAMNTLMRRLELRLESARLELRHAAADTISRRRNRLQQAETTVEGNNPQRILSLGFAVVRREGKAVRNAAELRTGDRVEIVLGKGTSEAEIIG